MRKNKGSILAIALIAISLILISMSAVYGHSGRTDSNGGHKDNQNKSGLGPYHYHCGGYPAHLHTNGVCPYSSSTSSGTSSSSSSSSSNKSSSSTTKTNTTVIATSIKINEEIEEIKAGETKQLTATILPDNTTNKNITWKSSNENIIKIDELGKMIANNVGTATITASTSNGKNDTIKVNVIEEKKEIEEMQEEQQKQQEQERNVTISTSNIESNVNNTTDSSTGNTSPIASIMTLGALGGGGYLGYKRYRK